MVEMPTREQRPDSLSVYVALSGGGAKGLGHIGVLKALEDSSLRVEGYAGTSAGAIVAALAAVGYGADDLVDIEQNSTIFATRQELKGRRPIDLIAGWHWLKLARAVTVACKTWVGPTVAATAAILLVLALVTNTFEWTAVVLAGACVVGFVLLRGLASLHPLRDELALLLEAKLGTSNPTFADLGRSEKVPLKVVAANLSTRQLELFSAEMTPDVPIAEAVVASASIPVLFRLPAIYIDRTEASGAGERVVSDHDRFCDGGIVSNLPAWLWDEERELHPAAVTIAADISAPSDRKAVDVRGWLAPLVQTALFGSSELNLRAAGRIEHVRLESKVGLMEFDAGEEKVIAQVRDAYQATKLQIGRALITTPRRMNLACDLIDRAAGEYLSTELPGHSASDVRRVAFLSDEPDLHRALRLEYASGFTLRSGERPLVRADCGAVGAAWRTSAFVLRTRTEGAFLSDPGRLNDDRTEWRFATPVRDVRSQRVGVLIIDGEQPVGSLAANQVASDLSRIVDSYLDTELLSLLTSKETSHGDQAQDRAVTPESLA